MLVTERVYANLTQQDIAAQSAKVDLGLKRPTARLLVFQP